MTKIKQKTKEECVKFLYFNSIMAGRNEKMEIRIGKIN